MARSYDLHVVRDCINGGWALLSGGRALSHHRTQRYAMKVGRHVARRRGIDLVTHGRDGRIRSKDSYGNESSRRDTEH